MHASRTLRLPVLVAAALALGLSHGRSAGAATIDVPCSDAALQGAIATSNANGREDFLWLAPACVYALPSTWVVAMDQGNPTWVFGRGAVLSGSHQRTVLQVNAYATLHLSETTVTAGSAADDGGAIVNLGTLTLARSTVSSSTAADWGGGIYNAGALRLTDSIVAGNAASTSGGGIYNAAPGRLTLEGSSVHGNSSLYGGGIRNGHLAALFDSTLFDNDASQGGAFLNEAQARATLSSVTLSDNEVGIPSGGGAILNTATLVLENSIVANTRNGAQDCYNSWFLLPSGVNLVEDGSCVLAGAIGGDPLLKPPDLSSARPPVLLPKPGSPVIDAGSAAGCPGLDQRGFRRPQDGDRDGTSACDLGAVEVTASACGLLGIEPFLVLPLAGLLARARRQRA